MTETAMTADAGKEQSMKYSGNDASDIIVKGGERTKSEWEELEKLSKDELIIELVRSRWQFRNLQKVIAELAETMGGYCLYEPGQRPSDEWADKIAEYAFGKGKENLQDWGVDEETADKKSDECCDQKDRRHPQ